MTKKLFSNTEPKRLRNRVYVILAAVLLLLATAPLVANTFGLDGDQYEAEASSLVDDSRSDPLGGPYSPGGHPLGDLYSPGGDPLGSSESLLDDGDIGQEPYPYDPLGRPLGSE